LRCFDQTKGKAGGAVWSQARRGEGAPCRLLAGRGRSSITGRHATACPAAITVLLLCLQLKQFTLSVALVFCFSIGLALTMVTAGSIAALIMPHLSNHWWGFGAFA